LFKPLNFVINSVDGVESISMCHYPVSSEAARPGNPLASAYSFSASGSPGFRFAPPGDDTIGSD